MPDKTLTCSDCGKEFTFTDSEQQFFKKHGFHEPKRCSTCRAARKKKRNDYDDGGFKDDSKGHYRW